MKKIGLRLSAAVLSAAMAAVCFRVLPDTVPVVFRAGAAETEAQPLTVKIEADRIVPHSEYFTVHTKITGDIPSDAWMAVVPAWVPHTEKDGDQHNGPSVWLKDIEDGVCTLKAPDALGRFEIRAYDGDNANTAKEIACFPIETTYSGNLSVKLRVENRYVKPDTDLKIFAELSGEIPDDAWISYVPSNIAHTEPDSDAHNGRYKRLTEIEDGGFVIRTPNEEGNYDIRVFDGDYGTAYEVAHLPIYLTESEEPDALICDLEVGSPVLRGDAVQVKVSVTGTVPDRAWIGVVPAETEHTEDESDKYDVAWRWVRDIENGETTFSANVAPGDYEIRVFDGDGEGAKEIANEPFQVVYSTMTGTVSTDETWVRPGTEITVRVNTTGRCQGNAWIGIVPHDVEHTEEESDKNDTMYVWVKDIADGVAVLRMPNAEGVYDVRLFDGDDAQYGAREVAFCTLTVSAKTKPHSAFETIEAETAEEIFGLRVAEQKDDLTVLGYIENGDYAVYQNLDFGSGAKGFRMQANSSAVTASGGTAELHLDSADGKKIGSIDVPLTGETEEDWLTYYPFSGEITETKGIHDLYIVFRNDTDRCVMNLDKFVFTKEVPEKEPVTTTAPVQTTTAPVTTTTVPVTTTVSVTTEPEKQVKIGDVNEDGSIDLKDVTELRRYLTGGWIVTVNKINADVNKDGGIDLKDVVILRRYLAGGWDITL